MDLTFTYGSPIQVNAIDCPYGTTTSCNSQVLTTATKYVFKNPLMDATTNNVVTSHTVTVVLSNFDGDVEKSISMRVNQIAPKYVKPSSAIINNLSFIVLGLAIIL